jgi:hypothetical protein
MICHDMYIIIQVHHEIYIMMCCRPTVHPQVYRGTGERERGRERERGGGGGRERERERERDQLCCPRTGISWLVAIVTDVS